MIVRKKSVLGVTLPAKRGIEDGEEVLDLLASHPSTARFIAQKLAVRFVSEYPPARLIERLVETWELTDGDLREIVRSLLESPEFWSIEARQNKVKSPLVLAISSLRALDAEVTDVTLVERWIRAMGQPLYGFPAPTGFPENGNSWTGVGTMIARINFAFALGRGWLNGVTVDLPTLIEHRSLASLGQAASAYFPVLMPERVPIHTLEPLTEGLDGQEEQARKIESSEDSKDRRPVHDPTRLLAAHAVSLLLASPEFQMH